MSKKNNQTNDNVTFMERITLPWLIITIASMISFLAFLIAMFFQFHAPIFFGVFLIVVAAAVFLDGVHKRRENYISGNVNFIMGFLCLICSVIVMNMN